MSKMETNAKMHMQQIDDLTAGEVSGILRKYFREALAYDEWLKLTSAICSRFGAGIGVSIMTENFPDFGDQSTADLARALANSGGYKTGFGSFIWMARARGFDVSEYMRRRTKILREREHRAMNAKKGAANV